MISVVQTNKAYYPVIGGIETIVTTLAEGLNASPEIDVRVLVCSGGRVVKSKNEIVRGVKVKYLPTLGKIASLPISPTFFEAMRRTHADILHIHEPFPLADLALTLQPSVWKNFRRVVVSWHSDIVRQKWVLSAYAPLLHRFLKKADRIIVATPNHIDTSDFLCHYRQKCEVIPYGVDLDWVRDRSSRSNLVQQYKEQFGSPLILFVGRLVYYKGIDFLIKALKPIKNAHLLVVGSGPLHSELEGIIRSQGLDDRASIIPHVSSENLHALYEASDVFVLPSIEPSEAFGIVQVEAMACGKPVISTNLPTGVTFVNQHGLTGITVPPRDIQALTSAIEMLIKNPELRSMYGLAAERRALREFTSKAMVEKTLSLYKNIL